MMNLVERLNQLDDRIITNFRSTPVLVDLRRLSNSEFEDILIQRRFLSLAFTPFNDQAVDGLEDEEAKQIVRELIREEYPQNAPSHREDLVTDLLARGLTKERILSVRPTPATIKTIYGLFELVKFGNRYYDVKAISSLRMAGEVLVAEEYSFYVSEFERRYGLKPKNSVFYGSHLEHDRKQKPIGINGKTHSDKLGNVLARLVDTEEKLKVANESSDSALRVKAGFYYQFLSYLRK